MCTYVCQEKERPSTTGTTKPYVTHTRVVLARSVKVFPKSCSDAAPGGDGYLSDTAHVGSRGDDTDSEDQAEVEQPGAQTRSEQAKALCPRNESIH